MTGKRLGSFSSRQLAEANGGGVRKAVAADASDHARVMARAFYDDPVVGRWCSPDESRRLRRLERAFGLFLRRVYLRRGESYVSEAAVVGGALWLPPGRWKSGGMKQQRLIAGIAAINGRGLARIVGVLAFLEARHPHEPHYYLEFVGVDPDRQGRGIGSALLAPVLERCDRDRVAAYLEASNERNCALYERLGFEVLERVGLPWGGRRCGACGGSPGHDRRDSACRSKK
jgi:ribosomal protein S18 acetylase RimI-like enzyme